MELLYDLRNIKLSPNDNLSITKKKTYELNKLIRLTNKHLKSTIPTIKGVSAERLAGKPFIFKEYYETKKTLQNTILKSVKPKNDYENTQKNLIFDKFNNEFLKTKNDEILTVSFNSNGIVEHYVVSDKFITLLDNFINDKTVITNKTIEVSDSNIEYAFNNVRVQDFVFSRRKRSSYQKHGGYFEYLNKTKLNLQDLQIFNKEQYQEKLKTGIDNCIIHSLRLLNVNEENINKIKNIIEKYDKSDTSKTIINDDFSARHLTKISKIINKKILLTKFYYNKKDEFTPSNMRIYGDKALKQIHLYLYKNHYMPALTFDIPAFVFKNYEHIHTLDNFEKITRLQNNKYVMNSKFTKAKTSDAIQMLERTQLFSKDIILTEHISYSKTNKNYLDNIENEQKLITKSHNKKNKKNVKIFYGDCETYTYNNKLEVFLTGIVSNDDDNVFIYKTVKEFLNHIVDNTYDDNEINVYFHNAKFDYSVMFKDYTKESPLIKDNQFYYGVIRYRNRRIYIKDSFKHISIPLSSFKKTYKLKVGKKDVFMPYSLYTKKSISQKTITLTKLYNHSLITNNDIEKLPIDKNGNLIKDSEQLEAIKPYLIKNGRKYTFRHMDYMRDYLNYDCLTLKHGFLKHRQNVFSLCDKLNIERQDVFKILTTSTLAYKIYQDKGTYDNVYEISGNTRRFVQKAVMGGRVSLKRNKKALENNLTDFDACSLYPSAIYRLKEDFGGIPVGKAKKIIDYESIKKRKDIYYVANIKVLNVNDNQQISFFNFQEDGKRVYSGDYERFKKTGNDEMVLDKITIEDYVNFQGMEYEFIEGIYWDKFDSTMCDLTYNLYELRKYYKSLKDSNGNITDEGDLLQFTTKLMLNSIYGKTLIKPSNTKIVVKKTTELNDYISKNYNIINKIVEEKNSSIITVNHNDFEDKNSAHIGVMILSMSKRIMNEVMDTANNNNIEIYYQDTDSMHMKQNKVLELSNLYNKKYNRILIGKNMGQFHNDLESNFQGINYNCIASRSIFLGKKAYYDELIIDKNDSDNLEIFKKNKYSKEKINELLNMKHEHIRLKGIGSKVFKKNYENTYETYLKLYNNNFVDFDLTLGSVKFENKNFNTIIQKNKFIRKISFVS